jgi:ferric-dicitrate binding protein FerR (iron transport regulator)
MTSAEADRLSAETRAAIERAEEQSRRNRQAIEEADRVLREVVPRLRRKGLIR